MMLEWRASERYRRSNIIFSNVSISAQHAASLGEIKHPEIGSSQIELIRTKGLTIRRMETSAQRGVSTAKTKRLELELTLRKTNSRNPRIEQRTDKEESNNVRLIN